MFQEKHDLDLGCRLFLAPNYCGEFDNAGAIMNVDEDLNPDLLTPDS
jgi:hypothetical protein